MRTKKCKECGKEINKKAEICPNCGCRVKSLTLKIIILFVLMILVIVTLYYAICGIKKLIHNNFKKMETEKALNIINSYVGKYYIIHSDKELYELISEDSLELAIGRYGIDAKNMVKEKLELNVSLKNRFGWGTNSLSEFIYAQLEHGDLYEDVLATSNYYETDDMYGIKIIGDDIKTYLAVPAKYLVNISNSLISIPGIVCFESVNNDMQILKQVECKGNYLIDSISTDYEFQLKKYN